MTLFCNLFMERPSYYNLCSGGGGWRAPPGRGMPGPRMMRGVPRLQQRGTPQQRPLWFVVILCLYILSLAAATRILRFHCSHHWLSHTGLSLVICRSISGMVRHTGSSLAAWKAYWHFFHDIVTK